MKRATPLLVLLLAACIEHQGVTPVTSGTAPKQIVPSVVVSDTSTAGQIVLTLRLRTSWPMGRVGSFTGRLTYDSTALRFLAEEPIADGALRALNPASPGLVRVAGAAANGMDADRLISLRFRLVDTTLARTSGAVGIAQFGAQLQLDELHEVTRGDLSPMIVKPAPPGVRP